jgi:hypothetical protein
LHCDDEVLALVALGEQVSAADSAHLAGCDRCREEVTSLGGLVAAVRVPLTDGAPVTPPARVWSQIARATGVGVTPRTVETSGSRPLDGPAAPEPLGLRPRRPGRSGPPGRPGRWGRVSGSMVAVAASALVIGVVGGVVGSSLLGEGSAPPQPQMIAQVALAALPADPGAQGEASVVNTSQGRRLRVDVSRLTGTTGFYEVWLIDRDVKKMIPLGILPGTGGEFDIPDGVDLGQYPIVDVSNEPLDGNPAHSGTSLLRGTIPT